MATDTWSPDRMVIFYGFLGLTVVAPRKSPISKYKIYVYTSEHKLSSM
jgi:hypothetical protein